MKTLIALLAVLTVMVSGSAMAADFIIECRSGGLNFANYTDSGFANSSGNVTAPGCTGTIGSRYSSTGTYYGPSRYAQFSFTPDASAWYQIDVAWPSTAGQIATAVNLYTGAAVGTSTDIWATRTLRTASSLLGRWTCTTRARVSGIRSLRPT